MRAPASLGKSAVDGGRDAESLAVGEEWIGGRWIRHDSSRALIQTLQALCSLFSVLFSLFSFLCSLFSVLSVPRSLPFLIRAEDALEEVADLAEESALLWR
jgi:hypothetical protein